jgi:phosphoribosylformylglycinamidine cyclo-ligase
MSWTYAKAGVDLKKVKKVHASISDLIEGTFKLRRGRTGEVLEKVKGHYAGLIRVGKDLIALHADGVGSKVLIAQMMDRYDSIGVDAVAMNANDLICVGAEPLALVDYIAVQQPNERMVEEIINGLVKGAEEARVTIVGGEVAVLPDIIEGVKGKGFDIAVMMVGVVKGDKVIFGEWMRPGDVVIGLESNGIHSNGMTLARKVLLEHGRFDIKDRAERLDKSIGEELLKPTRMYVKAVMTVLEELDVHALAHITGGAYQKLKRFQRYAPVGFKLDRMPEPPAIFRLIQKLGNVSDEEMYRTFNMGIGFLIVLPEGQTDDALQICDEQGLKARVIGSITSQPGIAVKVPRRGWVRLSG